MTAAAKAPRKSRAKAKPVTLVAYKGFTKDLKCRDFQFEIGKTYEHDGKVIACKSGFHSCENPLDVLSYYELGSDNRFCRVTVGGEIARHADDSKIASAKLTIDTELRLPDFINAGVEWIMALAKSDDRVQAASGDYSQLAASGYYSRLAASGHYSRLAASGHYSRLAASGYYSRLEVSGTKSAAATVGQGSAIKAVAGTPVAICEYRNDVPIGFATGIAGQGGVPADTWLVAKGGKLVPQ